MIPIDILYLLDRLEELLNSGSRVPLSSKTLVDEDAILDLVDQMRNALPEEVKQARKAQQDRDRIMAQVQEEADRIITLAKQEGEQIVSDSRERAAQLTSDHAVLRAAKDRSDKLEQDAKSAAMQTRQGADSYASEVLSDLKERLEQISRQVTALQAQVENGLTYIITQSANPEFDKPPEAVQPNNPSES
jgi:cell division septum initiation protein DivIVA